MARDILKNGAWVLVADSEKALFLENIGDAEYPHLEVRRKEEQDNPPTREQAANRRGRFNDGPSVQRSAVEDTDWHELAKDRFADDLADILYKQAYRAKFDSIVIVAAPQVLGALRQKVHKEVDDKIAAEVDKNLTGHPVDEIETAIVDALAA